MSKKAPSSPRLKQPARRKSTRPGKPQATAAANISKLDQMIAALRAPKGASISDLMTLTGWQMHSVRGAIAGALKKKRGLPVTSHKAAHGERVYRIAGWP